MVIVCVEDKSSRVGFTSGSQRKEASLHSSKSEGQSCLLHDTALGESKWASLYTL